MPAVAIGAVVAGAGAAASAKMGANGQAKAAGTMAKALRSLEKIDVAKLSNLAISGDSEAYLRRLEFARQNEPDLAEIRSASLGKLATVLGSDAAPWDKLVSGLISVGEEDTSASQALESQMRTKAAELLKAGGALPSTFQAELVRSGLETGGKTGVGLSKTGPLAQLLGNKIGEAQINLENLRLQQATGLATAADTLKQNRASILQGILPTAQTAILSPTLTGLQLAESMIPQIGLTGKEQVQLTEQARQEDNATKLGTAQQQANSQLAKAQGNAGLVSGLTSGVGNAISMWGWGNMLKPAGGAGTGAGGGTAGAIGNLWGAGGAPTSIRG